jgi:histone acetyltransferase 1
MDVDDELTAEIQAQVEEWSANSNDCFHISLIHDGGSVAGEPFHPAFTYPIFNDEEAIFGYRDLAINLTFQAHDMRPHLAINHGKVFPARGEVRPTDITEALADFLPEVAFSPVAKQKGNASFTPPGEKIHSYTRGKDQFEIWCASLADPPAKELLEHMQILVPMFIEGGTMLQLEQDWTTRRWKLFLLYKYESQRLPAHSPYSLVGYGTSYRVFTLPGRKDPGQEDLDAFSQSLESFLPPPDADVNSMAVESKLTPLDLPSRERLSQFLILPPFQSSGHGQQLYTTMYNHLTAPSNVREFTVEDPNEAFDDLRDLCDLLKLRKDVPEFAALRINTDIPAEKLASKADIPTDLIVDGSARARIMKRTKIMQRQFDRLVEMHTLSFIPPANRSRNRITRKEKASGQHDREYYFWRLYAKQRLYIFNRDQLAQLEREERIEKLEAALDSVQEGYSAMLEKVLERESGEMDAEGGAAAPRRRERKRKVVEEDEEEDEEAEQENEPPVANGKKKVRIA